jgi:hypothetical protein
VEDLKVPERDAGMYLKRGYLTAQLELNVMQFEYF